jgi:hypothetical protein
MDNPIVIALGVIVALYTVCFIAEMWFRWAERRK